MSKGRLREFLRALMVDEVPPIAVAAPVVAALAASYDIADLSNQDPDIEDVIRELCSRTPSG